MDRKSIERLGTAKGLLYLLRSEDEDQQHSNFTPENILLWHNAWKRTAGRTEF